MTKICIIGACGRMGRGLVEEVLLAADCELTGAIVEPNDPQKGADAGALAGQKDCGVLLSDDLAAALSVSDVLIDFSSIDALPQTLELVKASGTPIVLGTTGLSAELEKKLEETAQTVPCLAAPNMSLGVNLLFTLAEQVAKTIGDDFDIEIIEKHHNQKKDAPSGTAVRLADVVVDALDYDKDKDLIYGRKGMVGARPPKEVAVHTVRAGGIVGEHTLLLGGAGENLMLTHQALSRKTFVRGAIQAARFLVGKEPGSYQMADVLGLN